jgi:hypothetical protein
VTIRRAVLFAVLCLLLLAQHQAYVHPFAHLAGRAAPSQETGLSKAAAELPCLECALLADGFNALGEASAAPPSLAVAADRVVHAYHSPAAELPAWFRSRAPPVVL